MAPETPKSQTLTKRSRAAAGKAAAGKKPRATTQNQKKSAKKSLSEADWNFKEIPSDELALCFLWECLRFMKPPADSSIGAIWTFTSKAAHSEWFQRFVRRYDLKPLVLLAWIDWQQKWPDGPWVEVNKRFLADFKHFKRLPAILDFANTDFIKERHKFPLHYHADILMVNFGYAFRNYPQPDFKNREHSDNWLVEVFLITGVFYQPRFFVNWQQYSRLELAKEFNNWLARNFPPKVEKVRTGGNIDPMGWLQWLGAYRLYLEAHGDQAKMLASKRKFKSVYSQTERSLPYIAREFYKLAVDKLIPKEQLPQKPVTKESRIPLMVDPPRTT